MSDFEYQIPETYEKAVERKAYVLKLINEYNEALLLGNELPCSEEEIDKLQEEYQILNDHLALTEDEKLSKLKDSDKEVTEDGVIVEKVSFLDKIHWGVMLYAIFTFISLCTMPFLTKPIGSAGLNSMIQRFFEDCLWDKEVEMLALEKSEYMWTEFGFALRAIFCYCWLPLLLILISVGIYFIYRHKKDINTKICKWLIVSNIIIFVLSIGIVLLRGEIKELISRYEYLWYEYALYYNEEIGQY